MNSAAVAVKPPVLTCWKDIAGYMGKGVRTVQRWEQEFGLPVRRPKGSNKKAVLARPSDLDAWVALRCGGRRADPVPDGASVPTHQTSDGVARLTALAAQIQTARQLRDDSQLLVNDLRSALDRLCQQISLLHKAC